MQTHHSFACLFLFTVELENRLATTLPKIVTELDHVLVVSCHPPVSSEIASLLSNLKRFLRLSPVSSPGCCAGAGAGCVIMVQPRPRAQPRVIDLRGERETATAAQSQAPGTGKTRDIMVLGPLCSLNSDPDSFKKLYNILPPRSENISTQHQKEAYIFSSNGQY